jgi:ribonucleoside-diphosphate reductase alpha chain
VAPTGTVSLAFADNASNGIEPPFSWFYQRKKREADGSVSTYTVEDHAYRLYRHLGGDVDQLPEWFVCAQDMTADAHVAMVAAVQPYIDTAISKTVNVPADYPYDQFKDLYRLAWESGLKGITTYRPNSVVGSVLSVAEPKPTERADVPVDPMRAVVEKRPKGVLPAVAEKVEYWTHEGRKTVYLVVSFLPVFDANGKALGHRAIEFFMPVGQNSDSQQWNTASMRLLSLAARGGFLERALADMRKVAWDRGPVRLGHHTKADGTQVPQWHDSEVAAIAFAIQRIIASQPQLQTAPAQQSQGAEPAAEAVHQFGGRPCPECGAHAMIRKDGCDYCTQCGYTGSCG